MKKILLMLVAVIGFGCFASYAQSEEIAVEMKESKTRIEKLNELLNKKPKQCGAASIDSFTDQVLAAGLACSASAEKLENLYTRQISEPDADGVTEVSVTKPKLEDWVELGADLTAQTALIANISNAATQATNALTEIKNPMQIGKAKKTLSYSKDLFALIGQENAAEVKAVKQIIDILKSNGNL